MIINKNLADEPAIYKQGGELSSLLLKRLYGRNTRTNKRESYNAVDTCCISFRSSNVLLLAYDGKLQYKQIKKTTTWEK